MNLLNIKYKSRKQKGVLSMENLDLEMKRYGYNKENLYKISKREPKTVVKIFNQTLMWPKYSYPESDIENNVTLYITKDIANKLPEKLFVKITYDDARWIFGKESDVFDDKKEPLLITTGPGYDDVAIPHALYEYELKK